jgi:hypothetical protein
VATKLLYLKLHYSDLGVSVLHLDIFLQFIPQVYSFYSFSREFNNIFFWRKHNNNDLALLFFNYLLPFSI